MTFSSPTIAKASNAILIDVDGKQYIDLYSAHGTAWLGHANPHINTAIQQQLAKVWITGALNTDILQTATKSVLSLFPTGYKVAGFCSSGMEAFEFATRIARVHTGRRNLLGFARNMHGKSTIASNLCWDNADAIEIAECHRLAYPPEITEMQLIENLNVCLANSTAALVCLEAIQGSGGGTRLSDSCLRDMVATAHRRETMVLFDELLTGLYRTGHAFYFQKVSAQPDIVLLGKSLGNGFPVSAVVVRDEVAILADMLPGSTFANNPLAAAAVVATINEMARTDMATLCDGISEVIQHTLKALPHATSLQGEGAMWFLSLPNETIARQVKEHAYASGVAIGGAGVHIRLLPPATIPLRDLEFACNVLKRIVIQAVESDANREPDLYSDSKRASRTQ